MYVATSIKVQMQMFEGLVPFTITPVRPFRLIYQYHMKDFFFFLNYKYAH